MEKNNKNKIVECGADLAVNLLKKFAAHGLSIVISPFSVSNALVLTLIVAKNNTSKQIHNVIAKDVEITDIHRYFKETLSDTYADAEVTNVNEIFFSDTLQLSDSFKIIMHNNYNGSFKLLDFSNVVKAAVEINTHISDVSKQSVKSMISPNMLSISTKMIIINAINFEKKWLHKFEKRSDSRIHFHSSPDKMIQLEWLKNRDEYRYLCAPAFQTVELPYEGENYSMVIILPNERFELLSLLKVIDIMKILDLLSKQKKMRGTIVMPEFKIESVFDLKNTLKSFGITDAFDYRKADFSSGIVDQDLFLSSVFHKTVIEVSDEGTKAAAASAALGVEVCAITEMRKEFFLFVDQPFMYLIADCSKNVHFIGTFYEPQRN